MKQLADVTPEDTATVSVRLTKDELEILRVIAAREERSAGSQARYVLRQYIRDHKEFVK